MLYIQGGMPLCYISRVECHYVIYPVFAYNVTSLVNSYNCLKMGCLQDFLTPFVVALCTVVTIVTVLPCADCARCDQMWRSTVDIILHGSQGEYERTIFPFTEATKITYTWKLEDSIPGWRLVKSRKPEYGMHAVAYQVRYTFTSFMFVSNVILVQQTLS